MKQFSFAERLWLQMGLFLLAVIPVTLAAWALDPRLFNGIPIWIKPLKFEVSTAVHLITLAVLARFLSDAARQSMWIKVVAVLSAVASLEVYFVIVQAARGVGSHFNDSTVMDQIIYALMGVGALILIMPALVLGLRFLFAQNSDRLTPGLKLGAGLGLLLGFFLTVGLGGYMSFQPTGHWVDAPATDAGGVPVVGWTRQGGDLRVAHFFSTHLMQVLPFIGFVADRVLGVESAWPRRLVWLSAFAGVGIVIATFMQALAGQPFWG